MNRYQIEGLHAESFESIGVTQTEGVTPDIGHELHYPEGKFLVIGVEHRMTRFELGYASRVVVIVRPT